VELRTDANDRKLLDLIQFDFPVVDRPYRELGKVLDLDEEQVLGRLLKLQLDGIIKLNNHVNPNLTMV
jgi:DNA-binding Lrp family transcriptional regulator